MGKTRTEAERISKNVAEKRAQRCRHFNGVQRGCCLAGVNYSEIEKVGLLPCLPHHNLATGGRPVFQCALYETYTADELAKQEAEIARHINGFAVSRKAIVADLNRRHKSGDSAVTAKACHDDDFSETGCRSAYVAGRGEIKCPVCERGTLRYSRAACNGHIHAACSTEGCMRWME